VKEEKTNPSPSEKMSLEMRKHTLKNTLNLDKTIKNQTPPQAIRGLIMTNWLNHKVSLLEMEVVKEVDVLARSELPDKKKNQEVKEVLD